MEQRLVV